MKKNDIQAMRNLSIEQLVAKEMELRMELFSQRLHGATKPIKDNQSAQKLRKDIARILTCINQKRSEL